MAYSTGCRAVRLGGTIKAVQVVVPEDYKYLYVQSAERPIVKIPAAVLRERAKEVPKVTKKVQHLIDDLIKIMRKANGVGLAAPQVGISQRIIVVSPHGAKAVALVNPKITKAEGEYTGQEGCLSIPGLYGDVTRPAYIEVEALDRKGNNIRYKLEAMEAKIVQHEIDHLDGILFIDKVIEATLHWSHPDREPTEAE